MAALNQFQPPAWLDQWVPRIDVAGARQLLSTIAGAIITATSIAFSMTLVSLTLASSQLGPRLIRTFLEDRGTQYVLGVLVSTFLFCLLSLLYIEVIEANSFAMATFSGLALLLAVYDIAIIVYFIHHVGTSIQADRVIHRCFKDLEEKLPELLPTPVLEPNQKAIAPDLAPSTAHSVSVTSETCGYVQHIDYDSFLNKQHTGLAGFELLVRSGDSVFPKQPMLIVHFHQQPDIGWSKELRLYISIGDCRTPIQDPEFSLAQLVEIALRALSPGINDPYTAITCLDRLTSACLAMHNRDFPPECIINQSTGIWLKRRSFSFTSILDTAFNQIRQAGIGHPAIVIHYLHCLQVLAPSLQTSHSPWLQQQISAVRQGVSQQSLTEYDLGAIDRAMVRVT